jgi:hypothetical protein
LMNAPDKVSNPSPMSRPPIASGIKLRFPLRKEELVCGKLRRLPLPAYLASIYSAGSLIERLLPAADINATVDEAEAAWGNQTQAEIPKGDAAKVQKNWDQPTIDANFQQLLDNANNNETKAHSPHRATLVGTSAC